MISRKWLALAAWVSLPLAAGAQQNAAAAPSQNGKTVDRAPAYASVFDRYRGFDEDGETPDRAWRAANDEMARLGGHAGHMQEIPDRPLAAPAAHGKMPEEDGMHDRAHGYGGTP